MNEEERTSLMKTFFPEYRPVSEEEMHHVDTLYSSILQATCHRILGVTDYRITGCARGPDYYRAETEDHGTLIVQLGLAGTCRVTEIIPPVPQS